MARAMIPDRLRWQPIPLDHRRPDHWCEAFGEPWCDRPVCPVRENELAHD